MASTKGRSRPACSPAARMSAASLRAQRRRNDTALKTRAIPPAPRCSSAPTPVGRRRARRRRSPTSPRRRRRAWSTGRPRREPPRRDCPPPPRHRPLGPGPSLGCGPRHARKAGAQQVARHGSTHDAGGKDSDRVLLRPVMSGAIPHPPGPGNPADGHTSADDAPCAERTRAGARHYGVGPPVAAAAGSERPRAAGGGIRELPL